MMDGRWQDIEKPQDDILSQMGHEKLRVYQYGLKHVAWIHSLLTSIDESAVALDHWGRAGESIIENIAEGNGRFSDADQIRFLDIAHTCAMRAAAYLDVLAVRKEVEYLQIVAGKRILARTVPLILGLRGYLDDSNAEG